MLCHFCIHFERDVERPQCPVLQMLNLHAESIGVKPAVDDCIHFREKLLEFGRPRVDIS